MTAKLVAKVSVGQTSPALASLMAQALGSLQAQLEGAIALQVSVGIAPPSAAAKIKAAGDLIASLQLGGPEVSVSVGVMVDVIAALELQVAALVELQNVLLTAGVYVLTHHGPAPTFGGEMQEKINPIAPPQNNVHAVTFLATDPAVFEALGKILLTG